MKQLLWLFSAGMFFVLAGYSLGLERPLGVLFGFSLGAAAMYLAVSSEMQFVSCLFRQRDEAIR